VLENKGDALNNKSEEATTQTQSAIPNEAQPVISNGRKRVRNLNLKPTKPQAAKAEEANICLFLA
jgi:hypothetical protein